MLDFLLPVCRLAPDITGDPINKQETPTEANNPCLPIQVDWQPRSYNQYNTKHNEPQNEQEKTPRLAAWGLLLPKKDDPQREGAADRLNLKNTLSGGKLSHVRDFARQRCVIVLLGLIGLNQDRDWDASGLFQLTTHVPTSTPIRCSAPCRTTVDPRSRWNLTWQARRSTEETTPPARPIQSAAMTSAGSCVRSGRSATSAPSR